MNKKKQISMYIPLVLRFHRLMDVFAKSDDERDFYLNSVEGFLIYADLDKDKTELEILQAQLLQSPDEYLLVPKMTFFEIKKFMEGFIQEKVYDIDTKEKLLDIISASEPRENFLEYIYDNLAELEKWQLYYQERSRIRIIEWLRSRQIQFVFEEDLDLSPSLLEKVKHTCFEKEVSKEISQARKALFLKAKTYYSNEALNPRPKRGRPPKQSAKIVFEPQFTGDLYFTVPKEARHFLYTPQITSVEQVTFSSKFESEHDLLASLRGANRVKINEKLEALSQRLETLQNLSVKLAGLESAFGVKTKKTVFPLQAPKFKQPETVGVPEKKEERIETKIKEIFPAKKPLPEPQRFGIKKVTPIQSTAKKKKK